MESICQRCGTDLTLRESEAARFCYACGLPQLTVSEYTSTHVSAETAEAASDEEGHGRPGVHWRRAIRCAAVVAGMGTLLNLVAVRLVALSPLGLMWLLLASITTIGLYHRGYRKGRMDGRIGLRIGITVGLLQSALLVGVLAMSGFVLRYHLNGMGNFDAQMTQSVEDVIVRINASPSTAGQMTPEILALYRSAELRAASMMMLAGLVALTLTLFSTATGILGGYLFAPRRRVQ